MEKKKDLMTILIVDDNQDNREVIKILLHEEGYSVLEADNGAEALEQLNKRYQEIKLVISDILMPIMDGFQFCAKMRQEAKFDNIPFVFFTATYTDARDEELGYKLGAFKFLHKPMHPDKILEEINAAISKYHPHTVKPLSVDGDDGAHTDIFSLYSERLVNKLERKNIELENEIKKRKKIEEALLEAHRIARFGNWEHNLESDYIYCSAEIYRILGLDPSKIDITFTKFKELIHSSDRSLVEADLNMLIDHDVPMNVIHRLALPGGIEKYIHIKAEKLTDSETGLIRLVGTLQDVTVIKLAENDLKTLNQAIEQSPTSVVITNVEGIVEYVNPKFTDVTGYLPAEILGKNANVIKSGIQSKTFYKNMWNVILAGKTWNGEMCNRKKNGDLFWENASVSPIYNEKNEIIHFIAVKEDVTAKKFAELEREKALEEARKANEVKSHFMANMSHELRTPLNSILGFSDLVKMEVMHHLGEEQLEYFENIAISGERLKRTMHEILEISELETGIINLLVKEFDLAELLETILPQFELVAKDKKINLNFINDNMYSANFIGDKQLILTSVEHIIDNAIKYTDKGEVSIQLSGTPENQILQIKDTGIGMSEKYQQELFDVFTQESSGYSKKYQGVGLGLSLTKRYLDLNHVGVTIQSEQGKGTMFTLQFPHDNRFQEVIKEN
ncbi:MAG: response regulator [Candidatus Marinimicrobia bacterium]|nr:response regulator [Candidatus Neomarinimicrobiota bacterium]